MAAPGPADTTPVKRRAAPPPPPSPSPSLPLPSTPSPDSAEVGPACACTNIAIMQLFHELKQQFPTLPDGLVSTTISTHCHDKAACLRRLETEALRLLHAYPSSSLQARSLPFSPVPVPAPDKPARCPNRPPSDCNHNLDPDPDPDRLSDSSDADSDPDRAPDCAACLTDNQNYKISRISKVKRELNRKLEQDADDPPPASRVDGPPRPKRPDSLKFSPGIGYVDPKNETLECRKSDPEPRDPSGYPINVSLNLRMDVMPKPRTDSFYSPGSYTSVNLTVCTPTSVQNYPTDGGCSAPQSFSEARPRGFEGNLQITVNSAQNANASAESKMAQHLSALEVSEPADTAVSENLIQRQILHLDRLECALKADRIRLATMQREIRFLQGTPPPSPSTTRLRYTVHQLHLSCQRLTQQLDEAPRRQGGTEENVGRQNSTNSEQQSSESERQPWKCHICTFINKPHVIQCEICDMPRIILVHSDNEITVQLHPGCNKISRSWII